MHSKNSSFHLIRPAKLFVLIGVVGLVLYMILPSRKEAVERAVRDGDAATARNIIGRLPDREVSKDEYWANTKLQLELDAIIQENRGDIARAVPSVVERYEASNKTEKDAMLTMSILRAAGQPFEAVRILDDYEAVSGQGNRDHSIEMITLKVTALQETNRTPEAFDAYFEYFKTLTSVTKDDLTKLISLARAGNKLSEVIELVSNPDEIRRITSTVMNDAEVFERLGGVALAGGNNDMAIQHYTRALELDSTRTYLHAEIAKAYEWSGRPQKAFENYIKSLGNDDDYAIERLLDLAQGLYRAQDLGDVLSDYPEKIMELDKGLFLARVFIENGDNESAYEWYEKLCHGENPRPDVYLEYISILTAAQDFEKAVQLALQGQKRFPEVLEFRELVGDVLFNLLQYEKAFEQYYILVDNNLNHPALTKTIELGMALGKEPEITKLLQKHREAGVLNTAYLYEQLAMSEFRRGNFAEFQSIVMEGYAREPDNIHLLEKLFLSHQKLGNYDQAVAMIEQYPDQLLKNPYIMDYYLDHLVNSNRIARAEEVLESYPKDGEFTGDLKDNTLKDRYRARLAVLQGDYASAMTIYKRLDSADALQDYHLVPYLEIAVIQRDWTVANSLIEKMSALDHEDFYLHAARACLFQGDDTRAVNYANRVTTPLKLAHLWRDFGDYYENSGNKARARDAYTKSLKYVGLDF